MKEFKMQFLDAVLKMIEWSQLISKKTVQHHSNLSLCPNLILKKLRLKNSMIYKT